MTIFREIIIKFVVEEIALIKKQSLEADSSLTNAALSAIGYGRDLTLADAKRKQLEQLEEKINALSTKERDCLTLRNLISLIRDCKQETSKISQEKGYNEGCFGPSMDKLTNLVNAIYNKLNDIELFDIPVDDEPLHIFQYYAALYFAKKITESYRCNYFEWLLHQPHLSSFSKLPFEKETLILTALSQCETQLERLDKKHQAYDIAIREMVLNSVAQLKRDNETLCTSTGVSREMPLAKYGIFKISTTLAPGFGSLDTYMQEAIDKLTKLNSTAQLTA